MQDPSPPGSRGLGNAAPAGLPGALLSLVMERGYTRREEPFRLSSGGYSHDYVDLRRAVSRGADLGVAAQAVLAHLAAHGIEPDAIGGMTMGADPVAHAVAVISGAEWFSVRKGAKEHGSGRRVEGADLGPGRRAVVFEDTISTGGSIFEAIEVVRATGAEVEFACALLDRGDHAADGMAALGVRYSAVLTYRDLGIEPVVPVGRE